MLSDHRPFLDQLFAQLEARPGALDHLHLDHICYRTESEDQYRSFRDALVNKHELLVESLIGGRPIATFRLSTPLPYRHRLIPLLELPAPKPGRPYPAGWEHVELVTDRPLAEFADHLPELVTVPPTDFDRNGMQKARNPDLRLRLGGGLSVKFHEQPLDEVIAAEMESGQ